MALAYSQARSTMQLNILEFLNTLVAEVKTRSQLLNRVQEELRTFQAISETLAAVPSAENQPDPAEKIKRYLDYLKLTEQKIKNTHLILINLKGSEEEKEMNRILLRLLKDLNKT